MTTATMTPLQRAVANAMAALNDPEKRFDASLTDTWRKTISQGHTDGKPAYTPLDTPRKPAYVDFQDSVNTTAESINGSVGDRGSWSGSVDLSPTEPNIYTRPLRPREYRCENDRNLKLRLRSDLQPVRTRFACKDCVECVGYWRYCKRHRYEWGIDGKPLQTVVTVSGLADDNVASNVAVAIGRAAHGQRVVFLYRDGATFLWVGRRGICGCSVRTGCHEYRTWSGQVWPGMRHS